MQADRPRSDYMLVKSRKRIRRIASFTGGLELQLRLVDSD